MPVALRASPVRVIYPVDETIPKESKPRVPSHLPLGSAEQGRVGAREYKHYMVVAPPHRSLELVGHTRLLLTPIYGAYAACA